MVYYTSHQQTIRLITDLKVERRALLECAGETRPAAESEFEKMYEERAKPIDDKIEV
jgi:hypothetical protein